MMYDADLYSSYWDGVPTQSEFVATFAPGERNLVGSVIDYHYQRRDEIYSGIGEFIEDKVRMKSLFQGAYLYARRRPGKFAAKVITRGIPYVGWALLAYDAIQLYQWYQD